MDYLQAFLDMLMNDFSLFSDSVKIYREHADDILAHSDSSWKKRFEYYDAKGKFPLVANDVDIFLMGAIQAIVLLEANKGIDYKGLSSGKKEMEKLPNPSNAILPIDCIEPLISEWKKVCAPYVRK